MIVKIIVMPQMLLENPETLGFVDSLIDGTIWKDKFREYHSTLSNIAEESKSFYGHLAYQSIFDRQKGEIESIKSVWIAEDQAKWCMPRNFELMYIIIYSKL